MQRQHLYLRLTYTLSIHITYTSYIHYTCAYTTYTYRRRPAPRPADPAADPAHGQALEGGLAELAGRWLVYACVAPCV